MSVPGWALEAAQKLPAPMQEKLQEVLMKSMEDPYFLSMSTIPVAWAMCMIPHGLALAIKLGNKGLKYNNDTPRSEDYDKYTLGKSIARCSGAHYNTLEMFPLFAGAVLVARSREVKPSVLFSQCVTYLRLRLLYIVLYCFGVNRIINAGRTLVWGKMLQHLFAICELA
ncbi:Nucleolar protein 14-like [Hondaea fermentalgiana]|uniref:Nucleolar protein 14-like n=1 Tax=Hondaea fermentalgiana TaxID=2315210 RepID=A0A2R5GL39_9STRA|nr:Nucleolar protein 14-like [Hondaea fermentalgiana]|eukprot:GBG31355.1 Nucleolar protein 14-like [Hondaea fermentalgiana]